MGFLDLAARRRRRMGSAAPSLSDQVQAILAGTAGFALDPSDLTTMHQDTARTVPVALNGDPVGNIRSKWGTTTYDIQQATAGARPAWNGVAGAVFDNTDDRLDFPLAYMQNIPAAFVGFRFNPASIGSDSMVFVSTGTSATNHRFDGLLQAGGAYRFGGRRLDADGLSYVSAAAGTIVVGAPHVISHLMDYAGAGTITGWVNGVSVASGPISGTAGNTENTASLAASFGSVSSARAHGALGRFVFCPFIPTGPQRATLEAWLAETAL